MIEKWRFFLNITYVVHIVIHVISLVLNFVYLLVSTDSTPERDLYLCFRTIRSVGELQGDDRQAMILT